VRVGAALLEHVRRTGLSSVAIVGIAKNVGKTVAMRALYEAAYERGMRVGLVSAGRDGESVDAVFGNAKPRLWLYPGMIIAAAPEPGAELERVRVTEEAYYELIGPPTASGLRDAVNELRRDCDVVLIDGAIDRLAVIATGDDAIVVACGAAAAPTEQDVLDEVRGLVMRLRVPRFDGTEPAIRIEGALLPEMVAQLIKRGERRAVVVASPASIVLSGKAALRALERLRIRCERPASVVAVTAASIGPAQSFEPREFLEAIARSTGLATYDVYAGAAAGPAIVPSARRPTIELHPGRARIATALGREAIESDEFIVLRSELHGGPLPEGVRVVQEAPTYLLCEVRAQEHLAQEHLLK
jgi:hypothetical protein